MEILDYSLKKYFRTKNSPCLSFNIYELQQGEHCVEEEKLHRSDYFQVIILTNGTLTQQIEHKTTNLTSNYLSVIFPHQINAMTINKNTEGIVIQFDEVLFCSDLLKNELIAYNDDLINKLNHVKLSDTAHAKILDYAIQIVNFYKELSAIKKEQIRFYIKIMLLEIIEMAHQTIDTSQTTNQLDYFVRFKTLIEADYKTKRTVTYYANALNITTKKLNSICKSKTSKTALNIIHERLLTEIKRLLVFSGKNHKEIAFDLGFDSPSALNKFVNTKLKETPSELKEELSQIYKQ